MMSPFWTLIAHLHQRTLVDAGGLVRALELRQTIDVDARLGGIGLFRGANDDTRRVDLIDDARAARRDGSTGVARHHVLHAGADQRRFRRQQRHRLALHVGAHQRAVGVVVLEERHERRGHRHELLRRHVHELDLLRRRHDEVAALAARHELVGDAAARIDRRIGLGDGVFRLFHRREIHDLIGDVLVHAPCDTGFR